MNKTTQIVIIVAVVIIIILILSFTVFAKKKDDKNGDDKDGNNGDGTTTAPPHIVVNIRPPSGASQTYLTTLNSLADDLYTNMYTLGKNAKPEMDAAMQLNDESLIYLARYYKAFVSDGVPLFRDVEEEVMPWTRVDNELADRLRQLGERF